MNKLYKRIVILFITLLLLGGLFTFVYYIILNFFDVSPVVTDQEEMPPKEETIVLDDLEILWVDYFSVENNLVDIAAQINNPNKEWGAEIINYTFSFIDKLDEETKRIEGVSYILPNENKYILVPSIELPNSFSEIQLTINEIKWRRTQQFVNLELDIENIDFQSLDDHPRFNSELTAVIVNNSNFGLTDIRVRAVIYDPEGNIVGVNSTSIQTVSEGEKRAAEMFWLNLQSITAEYQFVVEAYSNIFENSNFISQYVIEEETRVQSSNLPSKKRGSFYELPVSEN